MDRAIQIFDEGNTSQDPKFKYWVRKKFTTMDIGNVKKLIEKSSGNLYALKKIFMTLLVPVPAIRKLMLR